MKTNKVYQTLEQIVLSGKFGYEESKRLCGVDWRGWLFELEPQPRSEAETFFLFVEGFVEEVDEGFLDGSHDAELFERAKGVLAHAVAKGDQSNTWIEQKRLDI